MKDKNIQNFEQFNENLNTIDNRINESDESNQEDEETVDVRVKDLITFLQKFDPETPVYLDKDGWPSKNYVNGVFVTASIEDKITYLIDDSAIKYRGGNYLMINN